MSASRARDATPISMIGLLFRILSINLSTWCEISFSSCGTLLRLNSWDMILLRFACSIGSLFRISQMIKAVWISVRLALWKTELDGRLAQIRRRLLGLSWTCFQLCAPFHRYLESRRTLHLGWYGSRGLVVLGLMFLSTGRLLWFAYLAFRVAWVDWG